MHYRKTTSLQRPMAVSIGAPRFDFDLRSCDGAMADVPNRARPRPLQVGQYCNKKHTKRQPPWVNIGVV